MHLVCYKRSLQQSCKRYFTLDFLLVLYLFFLIHIFFLFDQKFSLDILCFNTGTQKSRKIATLRRRLTHCQIRLKTIFPESTMQINQNLMVPENSIHSFIKTYIYILKIFYTKMLKILAGIYLKTFVQKVYFYKVARATIYKHF